MLSADVWVKDGCADNSCRVHYSRSDGNVSKLDFPRVGKMRLVRLVRLSSSSAIKVRINVKHKIRDRVTFKISVRAKVWAGEH